jgi:hypothetical protein
MKKLSDLNLGYNDAINYIKNKKDVEMFHKVFVKDEKLDRLMRNDTYFLIGEKGTGKTAYAAFLTNKPYQNTQSTVIEIKDTDFNIFVKLKELGLIQLSDFHRIWKIIILLLIAQSIRPEDIDSNKQSKAKSFQELQTSITNYYNNAFIPEISQSINYILNNDKNISVGAKFNLLNCEANNNSKKITEESKQLFQNHLYCMEQTFCNAFNKLKLKVNRFLFVDSVDYVSSEPNQNQDYMSHISYLAEAIWSINTTVFKSMATEGGYLKIILSIRPDIFDGLDLHNKANKIRDNGVMLDWRTTYEDYKNSSLYALCNRLLGHENEASDGYDWWEYYFPWKTKSTQQGKRDYDSSFINALRLSLCRPRDLVSFMKALQNANKRSKENYTSIEDFQHFSVQNEISNYYVNEAKDWCAYKFDGKTFDTLTFFFQNLNGNPRFSYQEYLKLFELFIKHIETRNINFGIEFLDPNSFLQLLYDLNLICYYEKDSKGRTYARYCYKEREIHNLSPKVKFNCDYAVHNALLKAFNLGKHNQPIED